MVTDKQAAGLATKREGRQARLSNVSNQKQAPMNRTQYTRGEGGARTLRRQRETERRIKLIEPCAVQQAGEKQNWIKSIGVREKVLYLYFRTGENIMSIDSIVKEIDALNLNEKRLVYKKLREALLKSENVIASLAKYRGIAKGLWNQDAQDYVRGLRNDDRI